MGESESVIITPRDMYDVIIGMRDDVQRVDLKLDHVIDSSRDHETRLRAIESQDYVTSDDLQDALQGRSSRTIVICTTAAAVVSAVIGVADFLLMHR
ncbi:hypothetical protein [Kitasatospora aureofaciens]|uniref:hypothetical protein n=1 Tax=Kitasatospora aureofaciens TaxID=1894 RepID=UPI0034054BD0